MSDEKASNKLTISPAAYFLSDMRVGFNHEIFHYVFLSGQEGIQHVSTPRMAKFIMQTLQEKISDFEKQFGEIKIEEQKPQEEKPDEGNPEPTPEAQTKPVQSFGQKFKTKAEIVRQTLQDTKQTFEDTLKF